MLDSLTVRTVFCMGGETLGAHPRIQIHATTILDGLQSWYTHIDRMPVDVRSHT